MNTTEAAAAAGKTIATVALAAFGLTPWAIVAALLGATFSYHFDDANAPRSIQRIAFAILAMTFAALIAAVSIANVPGFGWTAEVPVAVRAGGFGLSINLLWAWGRKKLATQREASGG